jgi:hypothetical protein
MLPPCCAVSQVHTVHRPQKVHKHPKVVKMMRLTCEACLNKSKSNLYILLMFSKLSLGIFLTDLQSRIHGSKTQDSTAQHEYCGHDSFMTKGTAR